MLDVKQFEDSISSPDHDGGPTTFAPRKFRRQSLPDVRPLEPGPTEDTVLVEPTEPESAADPSSSVKIVHSDVDHPKHYNSHPSGIECITITRWMTFNLGNVFKYVWRADEKGATIEDLKKARWYLDDEIARLEKLVS